MTFLLNPQIYIRFFLNKKKLAPDLISEERFNNYSRAMKTGLNNGYVAIFDPRKAALGLRQEIIPGLYSMVQQRQPPHTVFLYRSSTVSNHPDLAKKMGLSTEDVISAGEFIIDTEGKCISYSYKSGYYFDTLKLNVPSHISYLQTLIGVNLASYLTIEQYEKSQKYRDHFIRMGCFIKSSSSVDEQNAEAQMVAAESDDRLKSLIVLLIKNRDTAEYEHKKLKPISIKPFVGLNNKDSVPPNTTMLSSSQIATQIPIAASIRNVDNGLTPKPESSSPPQIISKRDPPQKDLLSAREPYKLNTESGNIKIPVIGVTPQTHNFHHKADTYNKTLKVLSPTMTIPYVRLPQIKFVQQSLIESYRITHQSFQSMTYRARHTLPDINIHKDEKDSKLEIIGKRYTK